MTPGLVTFELIAAPKEKRLNGIEVRNFPRESMSRSDRYPEKRRVVVF